MASMPVYIRCSQGFISKILYTTKHFREMLKQLNIVEVWAKRTIDDPDSIESHDGGRTTITDG